MLRPQAVAADKLCQPDIFGAQVSEEKRLRARAEEAEERAALFGRDMREFGQEAAEFADALLMGHPYCLKWCTDLPKMTGPWPPEWAAHAECERQHVYALFMGEKFPPLVKARGYAKAYFGKRDE